MGEEEGGGGRSWSCTSNLNRVNEEREKEKKKTGGVKMLKGLKI